MLFFEYLPPYFLFAVPQTEDLARMYRLFSRISKGLDPIADCFKEHVESEGMKLVKQVTEAAEAKKEKDAGVSGGYKTDPGFRFWVLQGLPSSAAAMRCAVAVAMHIFLQINCNVLVR